ncbi:MAG: restriction endonuclease [Alphaproteobacteria bacterium]|nr:restriction endonuclease [Alphaproteobacteria bacterium]
MPDALLAPLIDALSREGDALARRWINYRDLSVQHLGSIYERLLERDVVANETGQATLRPNAYARKTSGSYYTPEELVQLILRRAVGPLLRERREAFTARAAALESDTRRKPERLAQLARVDPAESILALRVCDPAMGSGHFLVSLVDYLAEQTLEAMADAARQVKWAEYTSPLLGRIEAIRAHVDAQAKANGWEVRPEHLDDRHIIRRIVLKRCIFGVDLNPMAVELAKLSLWLHSFTVGAPLSFLDHHLRCGDSLFGELAGPVEADLRARYGLALAGAIVSARQAAKGMARVEEQTDADIASVRESAAAFAAVEAATAPLRAFLDLYHTARWRPDRRPEAEKGRDALFGGAYGDPVAIADGAPMRAPHADAPAVPLGRKRGTIPASEVFAAAQELVRQADALAKERRFLHWEPAFPGVWDDWTRDPPLGGFDAVIGNPPWDRMKMQEVEWFAARVPAIAQATRAADRKRAIEGLRKAGDAIAAEYDAAAGTAEAAARVAREVGAYPLLSGGDVNIYALMVERAARLVKADGVGGLLVPSGIAADLGAAPFFRLLSTGGRLAALLDFENGKRKPEPFFPDVHRSFKFCALVFGGRERRFAAADCAFFQQDAVAAERDAFALSPADFAAVNPNTGTAPVFRNERDAAITKGIYARLPVLVDRRQTPARSVWPVRYLRMFDMTNDSAKFRTEAELRKLGAYQVAGGGWEKGEARWVPLYEGKMVQAYDHRAASVVVNPANVHRPAQPEPTGDLQHADAGFRPAPQFWVPTADVDLPQGLSAVLAFKDVTAPTNARTMIAALVPMVGAGNTLPLLLPDTLGSPLGSLDLRPCAEQDYCAWAPLLLANFNSFVLDYIARQKVQGQHLNFFIVEQLPVIPSDGFARRFGPKTAEQIVREDVLALTYTAHDMEPFARDMGYAGPPFRWDAEDRLRRRARLDALFFLLYGLSREEAEYVLGTFPIVREQEQAQYGGRFRTRDLVLNFMAALEAGRPDARVAG